MALSKEDGDYLIKISKEAIKHYLKNNEFIKVPRDCPDHLKEKLGVFCTLNKNNNLRGCIGYPEPVAPLIEALINVSIASAVQDPRFPEVTLEEFINDISIELTVLTKPELIKVKNYNEYLEEIKIGTDGLIIEKGIQKGLLLPQVAEEYNMDKKEFLEHTCLKAGLNTEAWKDNDVKVFKFQGQIFKE